jgi:hypothetical protein
MMTQAGIDHSFRGCQRASGKKNNHTAKKRAVFLV